MKNIFVYIIHLHYTSDIWQCIQTKRGPFPQRQKILTAASPDCTEPLQQPVVHKAQQRKVKVIDIVCVCLHSKEQQKNKEYTGLRRPHQHAQVAAAAASYTQSNSF